MDRAQRKRRAVMGAIALLRWRTMDADREIARARFEIMLADLRRQAEDAATERQRRRWRFGTMREDLPRASNASHYS
jgi:hypothetical protein